MSEAFRLVVSLLNCDNTAVVFTLEAPVSLCFQRIRKINIFRVLGVKRFGRYEQAYVKHQ